MKKILFSLFLVVSANALNLTRPSCLSNYHVTFTDNGTNTYYLAEDNPPHKDFYDYPSTCSDGITGYFNSYIKTYSNGNVNVSQHRQTWSSCPSGQVLDENDYTQCVAPACPDGQIQDADGVCVDIALPADFPTTDAKGTPSIRSDNTTESDCIPGTIHYTGIAYAQIIGWNSNTNKCEWGAFFCNSGLTWNNVSRTCEVPGFTVDFAPDDNASLTNSQTVSPELASACTSGKWAKSWTFDYCSTPAPCYIGLDVQGYNLQCGSKYIEYDCTSDYRVKKFLQVSCGDVAKSDFDKKDMEITSTTDKVPDTSSDSTNTDIADVINAGTIKTNNLLQELTNTVKDSNDALKGSLDGVKDSVDALGNSINALSNKMQGIEDTKALASDTSGIENLMSDAMNSGFDTYLNMDYTGGLNTSSCPSVPTLSINFHGSTITIFSQDILNQWPLDIFRSMIIFMFVFSGVIIAFRSN